MPKPEVEQPEVEQPASSTSFEAARDELASVVQRLESGGLSLEEALALWQRGEELGRICQEWLDAATATLDESNAPGSGATSY